MRRTVSITLTEQQARRLRQLLLGVKADAENDYLILLCRRVVEKIEAALPPTDPEYEARPAK